MAEGLRRQAALLVSAAVVLVAGIGFWGTAVSTAWSRLAALQTVEPYAWAVHEQLLYNFARERDFFQTIHTGYDDTWAWSGHRALTLPLAGLLYGLWPHPLWLAQIQIVAVMLGAIPAGLLGWRALRSGWGLGWGALLYLLYPPTMALALQDYQDLVFALPFLVFAAWAAGSGRLWLGLLGAVVAIMPREECIPLGIAITLLVPPRAAGAAGSPDRPGRPRPRYGLWAAQVGGAVLIAAAYTLWAERAYPLSASSHDMPLQNALGGLLGGQPVFLDGWAFREAFYALLWTPLGFVALLCPELALPAAALVVLHMTVPMGHGVDRSWGGHCHHMAPAAAFGICAQIVGGARGLRLLARLLPGRGARRLLLAAGVAGLLGWQGQHWRRWAEAYNLVVSWQAERPAWRHPAWDLVALLPEGAIPVADRQVSIAISNRRTSYTYDESLMQKAPRQGLGAATHLIVPRSDAAVLAWGMAMPGAQVVATAEPYVLVTWTPGAADPVRGRGVVGGGGRAAGGGGGGGGQSYTGPYRKADDIPGVPPTSRSGGRTRGRYRRSGWGDRGSRDAAGGEAVSWFERQRQGRSEAEAVAEQGRYLRAAGVDRAVEGLAGPFGVRRFLVHFRQRGAAVRIDQVESVSLQWGGGPPPADPDGARRRELEQALTRLHKNMSVGPRWEQGALGYVRDREGQAALFPVFEEDAAQARLASLPVPGPPGHPLEDPEYRKLLHDWEHHMVEIHGRTRHRTAGGFDAWRIDDDARLTLEDGEDRRRYRCRVLGLYLPQRGRFQWQAAPGNPKAGLSSSLPALHEPNIAVDWNGANELALLACAHVGGDWLFVGDLEDGRVLLAAAWG